ncbi:unnamed protein product [Arabidopsis halleri]
MASTSVSSPDLNTWIRSCKIVPKFHMTACSLLSYVAIAWLKMVPMQTIRSRVQFFKISDLSLNFCEPVSLKASLFTFFLFRLTKRLVLGRRFSPLCLLTG